MNWTDKGYLISKKNYNENAIIADVLTENHGKCSGIIYGGVSRKIKKYLQIGNKIYLYYKSKNINKIGYFQTELIKPFSPIFFENKKKIFCILSATSILNILLPDNQINKKIYISFERLMETLFEENWILNYIFWEQLIIKELGFDFSLFENSKKNSRSIKVNDSTYIIPEIFSSNNKANFNNIQILEALRFNRFLIISNFFDGNKFKLPDSRNILENYYKI